MPRDCGILLSRTRGVLPICSVIVWRTPWLNGRGVGSGALVAMVGNECDGPELVFVVSDK